MIKAIEKNAPKTSSVMTPFPEKVIAGRVLLANTLAITTIKAITKAPKGDPTIKFISGAFFFIQGINYWNKQSHSA